MILWLVPMVAVAIGTAIALGAEHWHRVLEPVRSFALAAVTVTIAVHLMPEAVEAAGAWALALLAGGLLLPSLLGWAGAKLHAAVAVELGFAAVIVHQIGDGLALGVVGAGHWDFVLAIGAHTVPLAAVVALELGHGRRGTILRAIGLAVAPLVGLAVIGLGATASAAPWLDALVAGLLLHVLAHDLPSAHDRTPITRTVELLAIAAGAAVPLWSGEAGGLSSRIPDVLAALARAAAPALLGGILLGALVHSLARRAPVRWLAGGRGVVAALRGAVLGVPLPPCSCDIVPTARDLRTRGGGAAMVVAFVLAAPELGAAAVLLTAALLGWQLALVRLIAALAIAAIAAIVVERIARDPGSTPAPELPSGPRSLADDVDDRVAHDGAWILVGLTIAAFVVAAVPPGVLGGARDYLVIALLAPLLTVSATAATPIAFALVAAGLRPGAALAAVLLGSMLNLTTLAFFRRAWGTAAAVAAAATAIALSLGVALAIDGAGFTAAPMVTAPGLGSDVALAALGALAAASLWRHGLAHWLTALRGSDHGHEHAPGDHDHHHH